MGTPCSTAGYGDRSGSAADADPAVIDTTTAREIAIEDLSGLDMTDAIAAWGRSLL